MAVYASCKFPMLEQWKTLADNNKAAAVIDSVLSGYAQIPFSDNSFTGLLIVAALALSNPVTAISSLFCSFFAIFLAKLFKIPDITQRLGLASLQSSLVGISLTVFIFPGQGLSVQLFLVGMLCTFFTVLMSSFYSGLLGRWDCPGFSLPFCTVLIIIVASSINFTGLDVVPTTVPFLGTYLDPAVVETATWTISEYFTAVFNGIAEMIFMADTRSGLIMLFAIAISSRIDAFSAIYGACLATLLAILLGLPKGNIMIGLYGFNAIFTMIVLFGRGFELSLRGFIFATFAACASVFLFTALNTVFAPLGAPTGAVPFALICVFAILGRDWFTGLKFVKPMFWGVPETISSMLKKERAAQKETSLEI